MSPPTLTTNAATNAAAENTLRTVLGRLGSFAAGNHPLPLERIEELVYFALLLLPDGGGDDDEPRPIVNTTLLHGIAHRLEREGQLELSGDDPIEQRDRLWRRIVEARAVVREQANALGGLHLTCTLAKLPGKINSVTWALQSLVQGGHLLGDQR